MTATKLKRFSDTIPGYDCVRFPCGKGGCGTDPGGVHGICSDRWMYAVSDGTRAISIRVSSGVYPASVPVGNRTKHARGDYIHVHAAFPTDEASIRAHSPGEDCEYLDAGKCFSDDGHGLLADKLFASVGTDSYEQPEEFWVALEREWQKLVGALQPLSVRRCPQCKGAGIVAPRRSWLLCVLVALRKKFADARQNRLLGR